MPGSQIAKAFEVNPSILAFRPRQVALLPKPPIMELDNAKTLVLKPEQKALLFHSIAQFLERSGFSKTVKKFMSEAKIQKDDLGDSSYNLEEIFCQFLDICNDSKNSKSYKVKDGGVDDTSAIDMPVDGEKKSDKASKSENVANVVDVKSKEKKKNKKDTDTIDQEQVSTKVLEETGNGANDDSKEEKKKKKKTKKSSHPVIDEEKPNKNEIQSSKEDEIETENKSSKKRKRLDVVQPACENVVEESKNKKKEKSKRRKTEGSEDPKVEEVSKELKSTTESEEKAQKEEINQACLGESQVNGLLNGSLGKSGEKSSIKKTMKKEQNGSAEPKSVKHFQRVKVDEVFFSDERLKNNSYWAKDGAEIGYGAKAQEILEQVRGRDFRHEKTKKKRGSYRGGQIDLQSHSVKFNYSDEE